MKKLAVLGVVVLAVSLVPFNRAEGRLIRYSRNLDVTSETIKKPLPFIRSPLSNPIVVKRSKAGVIRLGASEKTGKNLFGIVALSSIFRSITKFAGNDITKIASLIEELYELSINPDAELLEGDLYNCIQDTAAKLKMNPDILLKSVLSCTLLPEFREIIINSKEMGYLFTK